MTTPPQNSTPSRDPANSGTLEGTLRHAVSFFLRETDNMLPAILDSYDRENNVAQVRPIIQMVTTEGDIVPRAMLASVPVLSIGGGGFHLNFPLRQGDLGWIHACDRDISTYIEQLAENPPNTRRIHSFEDGLFIPDVLRNYTINAEDANSAVLQSTNGAVRVALSSDTLTLTAPNVIINSPVVGINSTAMTITSDLTITGDITTSGGITNDGRDISSTHVHPILSGSSAPGPTDVPNP